METGCSISYELILLFGILLDWEFNNYFVFHTQVYCNDGSPKLIEPFSLFSMTRSIGLLSYSFLMGTGKQDIVVPMVC